MHIRRHAHNGPGSAFHLLLLCVSFVTLCDNALELAFLCVLCDLCGKDRRTILRNNGVPMDFSLANRRG